MMTKDYTVLTLHTTMKTTMNQLCDQLIADMTKEQQDTVFLTGQESFDTIKDAKTLAAERGQFNGKATIAWNRHGEWLVFSFKKDLSTDSGWVVTARWLAEKPAWVAARAKPEMTTIRVPRALAYQVEQYIKTLSQEVAQ